MMIHPTPAETKNILLVGSTAASAFADEQSAAVRIVRRDTVPQAIAAMRREHFDKVAVSLKALHNHFEQALAGLRQADPSARIVLLAQMTEEPIITDRLYNTRLPRRLFDNYLIDPLALDHIIHESAYVVPVHPDLKTDAEKDRRIEELEKLVVQDDLTGLKNRRYLRQFLPQILDLARRCQLRVTLLIFDIDNFKHYNDAYGHAVGDNVLQQAGRMIKRCCRNHDVVTRLGGDEFAVVFWDLPDEKHVLSEHLSRRDRRNAGLEHPREPVFMAERFCKELSQAAFEFLGPKGKGALTISGGLATFPTDAQTPEALLEKADIAMLEAKRCGKNRIYLIGQPA